MILPKLIFPGKFLRPLQVSRSLFYRLLCISMYSRYCSIVRNMRWKSAVWRWVLFVHMYFLKMVGLTSTSRCEWFRVVGEWNSRTLYVSCAVNGGQIVRGVSWLNGSRMLWLRDSRSMYVYMWFVVPVHQEQSSVSRLLQWCSCCGVTILSCNVLQAMSLSAEDEVVTESPQLGVPTSQWHNP
jgi:hypothetical protein